MVLDVNMTHIIAECSSKREKRIDVNIGVLDLLKIVKRKNANKIKVTKKYRVSERKI